MYVDNDSQDQEKEGNALPSFDSVANTLLNDEQIKELPEEQQGQVIVDRFIGTIVRHGNVEGRQATYSPTDVLKGIDNLSSVGEKGIREVTSTDGLRKAVYDLVGDARVGSLVGQLTDRLEVDTTGAFVLTSPAQIEGYLLAGGAKNRVEKPVGGVHMEGDSWIPVVMEHIQRMAENPHMEWMSVEKARELMTSSAPLLKNTGRDWQAALYSAERVGVDTEILQRSAEKSQHRMKASQDMGGTALFVATEGRIKGYKESLEHRSFGSW